MDILMMGPGKGNNIRLFLDYFQQHSDQHTLTYYYFTAQEHYSLKADFPDINFIGGFNFPKLLISLRKKPDLIWIHNWTPLVSLVFVHLFKSGMSYVNFNVWSEALPKKIASKSPRSWIYKFILKRLDTIQCNWYGTLDLVRILPGINPVLLPWGLDDANFEQTNRNDIGKETLQFVSQLSPKKTLFFFPKSLNSTNRHDLVVSASEILLNRELENFSVYIWTGNHVVPEILKSLKTSIKEKHLERHVFITQHSFISNYEMKFIWEQMDCGLGVIEQDQLSASFIEPQLFEKEIIASDIAAYRYYEKEFGVSLRLTPIDAEKIANRMQEIILGAKSDKLELKKRKQEIEKRYRFSSCLENSLSYFNQQMELKSK